MFVLPGGRLAAVAIVASSLCAVNARASEARDEFKVVIRDFDGAAGLTNVYELRPDGLVVTMENDFGRPTKEMCKVPLSSEQAKDWARYLETLPLETMLSKYVNPRINDGLQLSFSVTRSGREPRVIDVSNMFQAELAALCDRVAALVPPGCIWRKLRLSPAH